MSFSHVGDEVVHQGHLTLVEATFRAPDGSTFTREVVRQKPAVGVVAVDADAERSVVLVRQFRAPLDGTLLEIPAGLLDVEGESELGAAERELAEEVGLAAASWQELTTFLNAAGSFDHRTTIYLARGLSSVPHDPQGVEEQAMTIERVPFAEALRMVDAGEITDAKTVIGLLVVDRLQLV